MSGYLHFSDETATQLQPPTRPGDARTAGNDRTRGRGEVRRVRGASTGSAANKFVLFTWRRTGFMITGGCSNLHKSELTITVKRLICKGKRVDSSGAKTSASLPTGRRGVQNDTGGENTEKEGSNLRAARTQWAKVERPPGGRMRTRIGSQWL